MQSDSNPRGGLDDDTLTPYEFAMEEIELAVSHLTQVLTTDERTRIGQACRETRVVYGRMVHLYPKLQLDPAQRDSLIAQLALLVSLLDECDRRAKGSVAAGG